MADDRLFLMDLADAVLEGRPLDWEVAESSASESQRALVRHLRAVAAIASFASGPSSTDAFLSDGGVPSTWAHLRVLEPIGRGSFGTVYRAWDPKLDREVALKLIPTEGRDVDSILEEGRLLARVRHINVVTIHGADRVDGHVGLWMEFVRGETLEQIVARDGPLPAKRAADIGHQLCGALAAVHRAGLVHRDVKAHNVVLEAEGRLVLMDFGAGLSRLEQGTLDFAGTPLYLAPEIFAGGPATPESDLYSTAVLLYYVLTRSYPTRGHTLKEVREAHARHESDRNVRLIRPDLPRRLAIAIERGLAQAPSDRFAAAEAMGDALQLPPRTRSGEILRWSAIGFAGAAALVALSSAVSEQFGLGFPRRSPAPSDAAAFVPPSTPATHRLPLPRARLYGQGLSYDSRYFSFTDLDGHVAVFDMSTGQTHSLIPPDTNGFAEFSIMSPDGEWVAYQWWTERETYEIRLASRLGQVDRVLLRDDGLDYPTPIDWSRDGLHVLIKVVTKDGTRRIEIADATTGDRQIIAQFRLGDALGMSLSNDNLYVAYDSLTDRSPPQRRIYLAPVDGSGVRALFPDGRSKDRFPLWTPDGQHVFFISDRSGTPEGWVVPVQNGVAVGEPRLVARNLGGVSSLGFTRTGGYYYRLQTRGFEVYEMSLDPVTMRPTGKPRGIPARFNGSNIDPSYSPDGQHLAYISSRESLGIGRVIVIRDLSTGAEREVLPPLDLGLAPPKWSPDARHLLVRGTNRTNQAGAFIVDVATGAVQNGITWLVKDTSDYGSMCWASGGTAILFAHAKRGLVKHVLSSGHEQVILSHSGIPDIRFIGRVAFDSTESRLAFWASTSDGAVLMVADPSGGIQELMRTKRPESGALQGWSSDDAYLLFTTFTRANSQPNELWRVPAWGGSPERLGLSIPGNTQQNPVAINPERPEIAYTAGSVESELWMMENFLPR